MTQNLWLEIPSSNKSQWVRESIRQRLARDKTGITDEYLSSLNSSTEQLRKVGINLSQAMKLIHSKQEDTSALPIEDLLNALRHIMNDVKVIKSQYIGDVK